jgi:hypothetical protein
VYLGNDIDPSIKDLETNAPTKKKQKTERRKKRR